MLDGCAARYYIDMNINQHLIPVGFVQITWTRTNPSGRPVGTVETVEVFKDLRMHGARVVLHEGTVAGVAPLMIVARFATVVAA